MLTCERVFEMLSEYLDGELSPSSRQAFERHIQTCESCAQFGREFGSVIEALRSANRPRPSEELMASLERLAEGGSGDGSEG